MPRHSPPQFSPHKSSPHRPSPHKHAPQKHSPHPSPRNKENATGNTPVQRQSRNAQLKSLLKSMAELASTTPGRRTELLADRDEILSGAIRSVLAEPTPPLMRQTALLLARLSVDERPAAVIATQPFLQAVESALALAVRQGAPGQEALAIRDAWRLSARAVRNCAAFAEANALALARESHVVRLLIVRLTAGVTKAEAVECAAALANFARYGLQFQAYIKKHGGLSALSETAQQADDLAAKFHACRALAEFSLEAKWLMLLIAEGCIAIMLSVIGESADAEILSEATRFLGNVATSRIGREAVYQAGGVEIMVGRVVTTVHIVGESEKRGVLLIDLLRTTSNLCVGCKEAAHILIQRGGVMAFIEAYGEDRGQVRAEAFRGLLIIAQGGHGFRASVLREIGIKIRQDTVQGRCVAHLYDLGRRIKVEASTERNDDFPQTIAGLGQKSKEYLFQAGPLATESDFNPSTVPEFKSPAGAFRQSGRLLSVQRPVPHRERLERDRRERGGRPPTPAHVVAHARIEEKKSKDRQVIVASPVQSSPQGRRPSVDNGGREKQCASEPSNLDEIPRCKVIERTRSRSGDGNWVLAVWSAVCNVVTRPPNQRGDKVSMDDPASEDEEGDDVYEIGVPLGRGGFATVFLAKNLRNGELVAVKRFHPLSASTPDLKKKAELAARRAIKEQRIWDGLCHKNVVSYRGCFFGESGELNLVAEYIPGWSLADHLSQISKFPEHMVACITQQIVDGLSYLHKCGVTHRDVKPANILVNPDGVIKITDFGVSSAVDVPTMTGNTLVGTPWYIAPEMIEGRPYGKSVDIWSLGCTVLELATGRRPYHNMRPHVAMFRMTQDRMPPIPKKLSPLLRDFLKTCWVWDPSERPTPANLRRHPFLAAVVKAEVTNLKNMKRKT